MDWLTISQIVQINQAIAYIPSLTTAEGILNQFWVYFNRTWMVRFPPSLWNIADGMMNRANNALERYNRRLKDLFANAHPNICSLTNFSKSKKRYVEVRLNTYSAVFRPRIRYGEALREKFNIYLVNN
ncbi:hypothetical protein HZS_5745 [Henneguya salminicola]|nr:hypothetical protein HZS_5745 [Henneguya salminicola]